METLYFLIASSLVLIYCGFKLLDISLEEVWRDISSPISWGFWDMVIRVIYGFFYIITGICLLFVSINILPLH